MQVSIRSWLRTTKGSMRTRSSGLRNTAGGRTNMSSRFFLADAETSPQGWRPPANVSGCMCLSDATGDLTPCVGLGKTHETPGCWLVLLPVYGIGGGHI